MGFASRPKKPVEEKYRHPADASLTWCGRGRKPLWGQALLDQGKTQEELAI
ncbi:H-NS histone family protein [Chromobacterium subtsugae]|uniref:H-NS histone family protein n=1 Tax=Chromobacterium subtsugae TaxID=251747 RepID=A0ABS7F9Q0_9NEIS|nr:MULTISPECIES: H-NS histone family protein [Chromobacterium]MBW7565328.1 H-NS histone family protein [Chromobacterium subtsugae]MBW8286821.1 H-NS histone family protein [Chromobacterium subtsugae]WSE93904.1 H-NS histone family protein [Chromobacterium subtsugae]WVH62282.1 H-NS histone family protein [Chromobacterium subtsugae]